MFGRSHDTDIYLSEAYFSLRRWHLDTLVAILTAAAAAAFPAVVFVVATNHGLRKNRLLVNGLRLVACVIVQFIAIVAATEVAGEPRTVKGLSEAVESSASGVLALLGIIVADVVAVIVIVLYRSEWVEPPIR